MIRSFKPLVWLSIMCAALLWIASPVSTEASSSFSKVTQLTIALNENDGMNISWPAVTGANRYRVRLLRGSRVLKTKTTREIDVTLRATLFTQNRNYRVKVRVLPTANKSASAWRSNTFTYTTVVQPPIITEVTAPTSLPDGATWLFFVDDGQEQLAVSTEAGQAIQLGRFDPASPTSTIDWQTVVSATDTGGQAIADHWHIFAHDYHWIAFSTSGATRSYLLQLTSDFERVALTEVAQNDTAGNATDLPTNDMFLVAEDAGVTVGHFYPGYGHKLYRFNTSAELVDTTTIGGGNYTHGNGASAYQTDTGFVMFAPSDLNPATASPLYKITFDTDWEPTNIATIIEADDTDFAMGSAALLADGSYIIHARKLDNVSTHTGNDDSGSIVQYRFASNDALVDSTVIVDAGANRPHTIQMDNDLYLTYDTSNSVYYAQYQIED